MYLGFGRVQFLGMEVELNGVNLGLCLGWWFGDLVRVGKGEGASGRPGAVEDRRRRRLEEGGAVRRRLAPPAAGGGDRRVRLRERRKGRRRRQGAGAMGSRNTTGHAGA
jgi:hypothetical protein